MSRIISDRADKTEHVVVLPASIEDPNQPVPGLYKLGMLLACASIFALFAGLVAVYIFRAQSQDHWEPIALPPILWWSTALILASSVTFEVGRRYFRRGERPTAFRLLTLTTAMGCGFIACQVTAWRDLVAQGAYMIENPHSALFYIFTGLHALHLVGGIAGLFYVLLKPVRRRETVDITAYYWHFLGLLWVMLYATLLMVS
ncbi:MAG: cytochrome c oxidase subunit 3 [Bryobacteraceae bacterium]